jgi:epoxide hydrolase-like predicted phosphatase
MPASPPKALLFDLGGVLIEIDFSRALRIWADWSALPMEELRVRFKFDAAYEQHERGQMDAHEYFTHLARVLELSATLQEIERGWNSIFVSEIVQTRTLVQAFQKTMPCYAFTNSNASHQSAWSRLYPDVVQAFESIFSSHELGFRKPEAQAFMRICQLTHMQPEEILFFDDLPENVKAAMDCGLQGVLVRSPQDVRHALERVYALR